MKRYSLVIKNAHTDKDEIILTSNDFNFCKSKYKAFIKYRKNCPDAISNLTKSQRKNYRGNNKALSRILNQKIEISMYRYWYNIITIYDNETDLYYTYYNFTKIRSGFLPHEEESRKEYTKEYEEYALKCIGTKFKSKKVMSFKYFSTDPNFIFNF